MLRAAHRVTLSLASAGLAMAMALGACRWVFPYASNPASDRGPGAPETSSRDTWGDEFPWTGDLEPQGDFPQIPDGGTPITDLSPSKDRSVDRTPRDLPASDRRIPVDRAAPELQSCPPGWTYCGTCVDIATDRNNCGGCGKTCYGVCSNKSCTSACVSPAATPQVFANDMWGCPGSVTPAAKACGTQFHVCSAAEWVSRRAGGVPSYHYWVSDWLHFTAGDVTLCGAGGNCAAGLGTATYNCGTVVPMHVCSPAIWDSLGNGANCFNCGYNNDTSVNQYFCGCGICAKPGCTTAGTLCCH
jgi:hypothetical protein